MSALSGSPRGVPAPFRCPFTWESPALYGEVRLYRDGATLAVLPPAAKSFIEQSVEPGVHEYAVQGIIGVSKSRRASCTVKVGEAAFLRGDADANGRLEISDGIFTLNYLFIGGRTPTCLKAADTDDSSRVDLSDAIVTLGFLFLGTRAPAQPYPDCGSDTTVDGLACESQPGCNQ